MAPRRLPSPMRAFRIGDPEGRFPVYSGEGASRFQGRWHERGQEVIYASEHYSTAMLEKLAHFNGVLPPNQHYVEITIPAGATYEVVTKDTIQDWALPDSPGARAHGSKWLADLRSAILIVPSYVAREENNVLINPRHGDFKTITCSVEKPVWWDSRLLAGRLP